MRHPIHRSLESLNQILEKNFKVIESEITQQLIEMKNAGLSYSTVSVHLVSLSHFFSINDVIINRKKLSKFVGVQENKYEYRSYTHGEISMLLSLCDERGKIIGLLLSYTGMRIGALPGIELKHLKPYTLDNGSHVYGIVVYATSKKVDMLLFAVLNVLKLSTLI